MTDLKSAERVHDEKCEHAPGRSCGKFCGCSERALASAKEQLSAADESWARLTNANAALQAQVTALREALDHARGVFAYYSNAFGYEACTGMVKKIDATLAALPQGGA